jgi:hypothetical protein
VILRKNLLCCACSIDFLPPSFRQELVVVCGNRWVVDERQNAIASVFKSSASVIVAHWVLILEGIGIVARSLHCQGVP